jgi:hypothetical protein
MIDIINKAKFTRGATIKEISELLGIGYSTCQKWFEAVEVFRAAILSARNRQDDRVVDSLYKRATGMTLIEQKLAPGGKIIELQRELPPDVEAIALWLTNRQRGDWSKRQADVSVQVPIQVVVAGIPDRGNNGNR